VNQLAEKTAAIRDLERSLWLGYKAEPSSDRRERLVMHYLPYVRSVAARYYSRRGGLEADFGDYLQLAVTGLLESISRYDPEMAIGFISYAQRRIEGAILNGLPKLSELHAQIDFQKRQAKERVDSLLGGERGKSSEHGLLERMVSLTVDLGIGFMLEGFSFYQAEEPADEHDGYASFVLKEHKEILRQHLEALPPKERYVLRYHYLFGFGLEDIAKQMELTKGRVSQLHRQALARLRDMLNQDDVLDIAI
jgi:RNA polymerase sigma factor for flagellar operon FliA